MKKISLTFFFISFFIFSSVAQVVPQGYLIGPKSIGGQLWALVNLSTATFTDGTAIPYYTSAAAFAGLTTPANAPLISIPQMMLFMEDSIIGMQ